MHSGPSSWVSVNGEACSIHGGRTDGWRAMTGICKYFCEWKSSWHCFRHPISGSFTVHYHWENGIDLQERGEKKKKKGKQTHPLPPLV